jgi:chemotaxis signal transduction protein
MDLKNLNSLIENCKINLNQFPHNFFSQAQSDFDALFIESDRLNLVIFKSSLVELFQILKDIDEILQKIPYTDPDVLAEAKLFLSGGFLDLSCYLKDLKKISDSPELKKKHSEKLSLLKDWVQEFALSVPHEHLEEGEVEHLERFIIFKMGHLNYAVPESSILEILNVKSECFNPIEDPSFSSIVSYKGQNYLIWNKEKILGISPIHEEVKTLLVGHRVGANVGLDVDKILKIQELDTNLFTSIEDITGPNYLGPIQSITLYEGQPLFVYGRNTDEYLKDIIPYHLLGDAR